ncbi:protein of unknown function (plasmid) [Azospirillum lipoferum 4B]|uniref:Uncharacterized protein n=1 Tax=Azospirillum lipoferum (strain 4B) TaxID=862719 RepID=G7ZHR1_AZOL4|nr:protein of unknown function [Azospirillum lipoferum 4B]
MAAVPAVAWLPVRVRPRPSGRAEAPFFPISTADCGRRSRHHSHDHFQPPGRYGPAIRFVRGAALALSTGVVRRAGGIAECALGLGYVSGARRNGLYPWYGGPLAS